MIAVWFLIVILVAMPHHVPSLVLGVGGAALEAAVDARVEHALGEVVAEGRLPAACNTKQT